MGASPSISSLRLFAPSPCGGLYSVLVCATRIMLQGYSCRPTPLHQGMNPVEVTFLVSATTKSGILIALSRMDVCRSGSTIPSASKRLSQYSLFFALLLGVILLHQKKNHIKQFFSCPMPESNLQTKEWCPTLNRVCLPIPPMGHKAEIPGFEPRRSDSKSEMLPITSYLNGRCGRTRTCDLRFWRPLL